MRCLLALLVLLSWLSGDKAAAQTANPEIWFNPHSPVDWLNVFQDSAPWPYAASKVTVMTLEPAYLRGASNTDILSIANYAARHNMRLNLDVEAVTKYPADGCASGEGYRFLSEIIPIVQNLKNLNIQLDSLHMDEPVWFGHYDTESTACQFAIPDVVSRVVTMLSGILAIYPDLRIVEIEPIPDVMSFADWRDSLTSFRVGVTQQINRPIVAIQTDVNWDNPGWQPAMTALNTYLHEQNMGLGIIYDGSGNDVGDQAWINHAVNNFETTEGNLGIIPAEAVFASWNTYPTYDLPETSPTAQTWLIDRYFLQRSKLDVQFVGQGAHGTLTTDLGKPIANASVKALVPGVDFNLPLPEKSVQGIVPAAAVQGLIGFRLNTECRCNGINDILIGTIRYQETSGGSVSQTASFPTGSQIINGVVVGGEWVGGVVVTRVIANPGQTFLPNLVLFNVTPGASYTFTVPSATIGGNGWYGNVFIIWVDANGNGLFRTFVIPDAGNRTMSTAITNPDGTFALPSLPRVGPGAAPVSVYFDGGGRYRSTTWTPLR